MDLVTPRKGTKTKKVQNKRFARFAIHNTFPLFKSLNI